MCRQAGASSSNGLENTEALFSFLLRLFWPLMRASFCGLGRRLIPVASVSKPLIPKPIAAVPAAASRAANLRAPSSCGSSLLPPASYGSTTRAAMSAAGSSGGSGGGGGGGTTEPAGLQLELIEIDNPAELNFILGG